VMYMRSAQSAYTRFKSAKFNTHAYAAKATQLFVRGVLARIVNDRNLTDIDQALFYVGCPSGWMQQTREVYQDVLKAGGLRNVRVVPESRAALLEARESREISEADLEKRILLIDIGSSTTDFTYVENLNLRAASKEKPIDFGHTEQGDIGAGLFDALIFDHIMAQQPDSQRIREILDRFPQLRARVDLKCREAKHEYFNMAQGNGRDVYIAVRLDSGVRFEGEINDAVIEELKNTPIAELGNFSWVDAFRDRLRLAKAAIDAAPDLILLTGGAARMNFVLDLIDEVFPRVLLRRGHDPELAIAKGLAWFGRALLKSEAFRRAVDDLRQSSKIKEIVAQALPQLYDRLADRLAREITEHALKPVILRWRGGEIQTLRGMEAEAKASIQRFLEGAGSRAAIEKVVREWFDDLRPRIQKLTDPICSQHHIPTSALALPHNMQFATASASGNNISELVTGDLNRVGLLINALVATISAWALGGAGIALLHIPLIGQILAGVLIFAGFFFGQNVVLEKISEVNIQPVLLRKALTTSNINRKLAQSVPEIVSEIRNGFTIKEQEALPGAGGPADRLAEAIAEALRQRGEDAILRFG
jgi:Hsp70 protein